MIRARIGGMLVPEAEDSLLYSRPLAEETDILYNDLEGAVRPLLHPCRHENDVPVPLLAVALRLRLRACAPICCMADTQRCRYNIVMSES